jgi:putative ABC transport system permease protein
LKPGVLLHLYRIRLRSRLGAELLALLGIAVGVALVFASLIANASLVGSVRQLSDGIVGRAEFQLAARSAEGFDPHALRQVRRIPGATAAPLAEAKVNLVGPKGSVPVLLVGADSRFEGVGGDLLRAARGAARRPGAGLVLPGPLAAALGTSSGGSVRVETGVGTARVPVVGQLDAAEVGPLAEAPVAMAPLRLVQRLTALGPRISRIFVDAAPRRADAVEVELEEIAGNRLNLGPADEEVAIFERAAYPTSQSTTLFSFLSALVGFLFAFNAVLLTVPQRRRLIADLRIAGYEPVAVARILLLDGLALGAMGAVLGLLLGETVSRALFESVPDYLTSAFAVGTHRSVSGQSAAMSAAAGLLAASVAVLSPLRGSLGMRGRGEGGIGSRRYALFAAVALALAAVALAIGAWVPDLALGGIVALLLALLLLLPAWLGVTVGAFDAVARRLRGPAPIYAAIELRAGSAHARTLALAATGAVAVFATVSIGGARGDLQRGVDVVAADLDRGAEVWTAFKGPANIFGTTAIDFPPRQLAAIKRIEGVRGLRRNRAAFLDVEGSRAWVLAPAPAVAAEVLGRQVRVGRPPLSRAETYGGGWVALSEGLASHLGVGVWDRVDLPLPRPRSLRVTAITSNFGWPGGAVVLSGRDFRRAWGGSTFSVLGIDLEKAVDPVAVVRRVDSILRRSPLRVETAAERERRQRETSRSGLVRLSQIAAMVLLSAVLAMAASMAGMVWQRRPRFAALKVQGLNQTELWCSLLLEATLLLAAGCLLGGAFGLLGQILLDRALEALTGFPVVSETALPVALRVGALLVGSAVAVLAIPGWLAVRVPPRTGIAE